MKLINEDNVNIQNTTKYTEKNNNDRFLDAKSAEKLEKMFELQINIKKMNVYDYI